MITSVSIQYATALFDIALEQKMETEYLANLETVSHILNQNDDILRTFVHPKISREEKKRILNHVLATRVDQSFLYFLYVLIDNERLEDISNILESYRQRLYEYQKQMVVDIYTKYPLDDAERKQILQKLSTYFQKQMIMKEHLDPELIAGIKVVADGKIIDDTIFQRLESLRTNLKKGW